MSALSRAMATSAASSPRLAFPGARRPRARRVAAAVPRGRALALLLRVAMTMKSPLLCSVRESPIAQNVAMDSITRLACAAVQLPAQRLDESGREQVDQRAVLALALPLMANSAVQIILNLTDMWF